MPTSTYCQIQTVVRFLQTLRPTSILDVGVGNGKMGFIARDYLDVMLGQNHRKKDWKIRLDGIEIFPDYVQVHQRFIYDHIFIGDAFEVIDGLGAYDLVILGDVLEHLEKDRAWGLLDKCTDHAGKAVILSIPLGEKWQQPALYGNPHEEHRSFWNRKELESFALEKELFEFPEIGLYGCYLIDKKDYHQYRIRQDLRHDPKGEKQHGSRGPSRDDAIVASKAADDDSMQTIHAGGVE
jgi:hypothetical protein